MTRKKHSWKKTWILPELRAKKGRRPLKASLSGAGKIELGSKSWPSELSVGRVLVKYRPSGGRVAAEWRPSGGRVAVKYRPGVGRHACRFMSTDTRPSLGRHIGRVSVEISAECRSPYRPIVSTDTRSTDALSTHDPKNLSSASFSKNSRRGCWQQLFQDSKN